MSINQVSDEEDYSSDEVSTEYDSVKDFADYPDENVYQDEDIKGAFSMLRNRTFSLPRNEDPEDPPFT
jgi:hypothetical protein